MPPFSEIGGSQSQRRSYNARSKTRGRKAAVFQVDQPGVEPGAGVYKALAPNLAGPIISVE